MALSICSAAAVLALTIAHTVSAVSQDPAWVLPGESVPADTIRLTALGTGTPNVYKEQVMFAQSIAQSFGFACACALP